MTTWPNLNGATATRAQFATILAKILGEAADVGTGHTFEDIESDTWYSAYTTIALGLPEIPARRPGVFEPAGGAPEDLMAMVRKVSYQFMSAPGVSMPGDFQLQFEQAACAKLGARGGARQAQRPVECATRGMSPTAGGYRGGTAPAGGARRAHLAESVRSAKSTTSIQWAENQLAQGSGLGSDLTQLGGDTIDPSALLDPGVDFDPTSNSISASATLPPEVTLLFSGLLNSSFPVFRERSRTNRARRCCSSRARHHLGSPSSSSSLGAPGRSGELDICVRYNDQSGDFDTGSASDPNGALLVNGHWSLIDGQYAHARHRYRWRRAAARAQGGWRGRAWPRRAPTGPRPRAVISTCWQFLR